MSCLTLTAKESRPAGVLNRTLCALGFSLAISAVATSAQAACQYQVTGQWSTGFTASIKITNEGTSATNGWNLSWQYAGDNRVTGGVLDVGGLSQTALFQTVGLHLRANQGPNGAAFRNWGSSTIAGLF